MFTNVMTCGPHVRVYKWMLCQVLLDQVSLLMKTLMCAVSTKSWILYSNGGTQIQFGSVQGGKLTLEMTQYCRIYIDCICLQNYCLNSAKKLVEKGKHGRRG